MKLKLQQLLAALLLVAQFHVSAETAEVKNVTINGGIEEGKARLVIEAVLNGSAAEKEKSVFAAALEESIQVGREKIVTTFQATLDILQGEPKELSLTMGGQGEIKEVKGDNLLDWSVRQETNQTRALILRPRKTGKSMPPLVVTIVAEEELKDFSKPISGLTLIPPQASLLSGYLKIRPTAELHVQLNAPEGLVPLENKYLPAPMREESKPADPEILAYRILGSAYVLPMTITVADPDSSRVVLRDFHLVGEVKGRTATFLLTATASIKDPKGASVKFLSGQAAVTSMDPASERVLKFVEGEYRLEFEKPGDYPVRVKFNATVNQSNGWNSVDFQVATSPLQSFVLQGLAADTQFQFAGAARPERVGSEFTSFLAPDGAVKLSWKEAAAEESGKLFFAAEVFAQVTISPGLMRQAAVVDFKVMQGELSRVSFVVHGTGEVTQVQGDNVLSWNVSPIANSIDRRLTVRFNQPEKDHTSLQLQMQSPLGAFPQTVDAMQLRPEGTTRFSGFFRIVNEGAVRLEVVQANGLSQISPNQFPESDATRNFLRTSGAQRFVYRFSGGDFSLRIQAEQILPELAASEVIGYKLGENELSIDAEIELEIRDAPLRELLLHVPKGYALAGLSVPGMSDYSLRETADQSDAELHVIYGQPMNGRQVIRFRLERNQPLGAAIWPLPRIEVAGAKSVRGHVAVSADAGFRLTPERTQGVTEIATAYFPRKIALIQSAFRIVEASWSVSVRVERLPQTVQADTFHLFSIGEGVAYGSSVINYSISGSPVSLFRIELSNEYFNVEFTGKDIRNWQKTTNGYIVQLHTPVAGPYTLLATYERPFKAQGETLTFTGARPLDAQSEQGHTIVISAYQFQVKPVDVSSSLQPLEPGEVPAEYRLFFDAPILAAYRYNSRPFNLRLALSPLAQRDSLSQVVDRSIITTRISKEGQVVTDLRYLVKNRGNPHFRVTLPPGSQLWSATVNGVTAVPVMEGKENLVPLPQKADPNAVITVELKVASTAAERTHVRVETPAVGAPVMLAEWNLTPDPGQRLIFRNGSLTPAAGVPDVSGFAGLARLFREGDAREAWTSLFVMVFLSGLALALWRWTVRDGVYKFGLRHSAGLVLGICAWVIAAVAAFHLASLAKNMGAVQANGIQLLAPVQQPGSSLDIDVSNISYRMSVGEFLNGAWPALLAVFVGLFCLLRVEGGLGVGVRMLAWILLAWGTLRWPNGASIFIGVILLFLLVEAFIPSLRRMLNAPPNPRAPSPPDSGPAPIIAALLILASIQISQAQEIAAPSKEPPVATTVAQQIRIEEKYGLATAKVHWNANKGQMLPVLFEPAVLTHATYPTNAIKLVQAPFDDHESDQFLALESGAVDLEIQYQFQVTKGNTESGFLLPTQFGLVNEVNLTVAGLDVDVSCLSAVSNVRETAGTNTVAHLFLAPTSTPRIAWHPRSRDLKNEKASFYAEVHHLFVPSAGVIEGVHQVSIRPAQGELSELVFDIPADMTIMDVTDAQGVTLVAGANARRSGSSIVSLWRFDPETRKLRVDLSPVQSRSFVLVIRSQTSAGALPFEKRVGLPSVENAAGQIGLIGVATGSEVQLDSVIADLVSPINLEDFPAANLALMRGQTPGLTVRRAFRYADTKATVTLKASAVEPDVRVEIQETVSLGEDRTVLAANSTVDITRAGIFRLSFVLPAGFEVESISGSGGAQSGPLPGGQVLSHWTESKSDTNRVITLHLSGKTQGQTQFAITLAGAGVKATNGWNAPQLVFREASKQRGTLMIVPEQGMRLQMMTRDGVTLLDPAQSGIQQKGVLAFRILQTPWNLSLGIEQVDPWVQVTSLQHAAIGEAQLKVAVNFQYQIENAGLKSLRLFIPTNAENVRFQGEQVGDFLPVTGSVTNGMQVWEVKLQRRVVGAYFLQLSYQTALAERAPAVTLRGVQALDVNLQRGFVTIHASGRLQIHLDAIPQALQPSEWQSIPRALQKDLLTASANLAFRLVEPAFSMTLKLERNEAAKLLPARVNHVTFTSVISDDGAMLTQARLEIIPGDKRLLYLTLPKGAQFWFAFVDQNGVWPWREEDRILIPLEQQSKRETPASVEVFFSSKVGNAGKRSLDLELLAPKFDLPLEDVSWRVYLNSKWKLTHWSGSLQLQENDLVARPVSLDVESYLSTEASAHREKTKEAEQMLSLGNSALQQGDPQEARRAFHAAFGLSQGDDAFNEDARVQLNNLKLQQALVGLNFRQAGAAGGGEEAMGGSFRGLREKKVLNYTQQDARSIIERNSSEENAVLMRVAQRLIQQQDASVTTPAAIRANIPEQGRLLVFKRSVVVNNWADLNIDLKASAVRTISWSMRIVVLGATFLFLMIFAWLGRPVRA